MHPIEHLRYVARSSGAPSRMLAIETASALAGFVGDDAALVTACKRMVAKQPTIGSIAWLAAHVLGSGSPAASLWEAADELEGDRTDQHLVDALPDQAAIVVVGWPAFLAELTRRRGDVRILAIDLGPNVHYSADRGIDLGLDIDLVPVESVGQVVAEATHTLVELLACGPDACLAPTGSLVAAAMSRYWEKPVWGVAGTGTMLPTRMYGGVTRRWHDTDADPIWSRPVEELSCATLDRIALTQGVLGFDEAVATTSCPIVPELF